MQKYFYIIIFVLNLLCLEINAQDLTGYIISIENSTINVDLNRSQVQVGTVLQVLVKGGYSTDPETGRRVRMPEKVIGDLRIMNTYTDYSEAAPMDNALLAQLKPGMRVTKRASMQNVEPQPQKQNTNLSVNERMVNAFVSNGTNSDANINQEKINITIAHAQVNDVVNNGHFGGYVADILMEQMLTCDKVRILDRSILNDQLNELDLSGHLLDQSTTIKQEKALGARYILQTTMQKPDVANVRTGIPLASVMGAIQGATNTNIGAAYASNINFATLKASVSISVRVVDLQTGEIVFMCSGNGKAQGKSQLSLEYGALSGGELNGGAEDFKQTVTGKAIKNAFVKIGRNLKDYFNGRTNQRVMGSVAGGASYDDKMYARGFKIYLGTQKLDKEGIASAFSGNSNLYYDYLKAKKQKKTGWIIGTSIAIVGTSIGAVMSSTGDVEGINAGYGIMAGSIVGGITFGIIKGQFAKKKLQRVIQSYNNSISRYSDLKTKNSHCYELAFSPTGIRFTF